MAIGFESTLPRVPLKVYFISLYIPGFLVSIFKPLDVILPSSQDTEFPPSSMQETKGNFLSHLSPTCKVIFFKVIFAVFFQKYFQQSCLDPQCELHHLRMAFPNYKHELNHQILVRK